MDQNFYTRLRDKIASASSIILTTHIIPDADGLGSQIALKEALNKMGKTAYCVNEAPLNERYHYLDPQRSILSLDEFKTNFPEAKTDLIIAIDTNKIPRLGQMMAKYLTDHTEVIFIDHHPSSRQLDPLTHFVDLSAAATGQIVGEFIKFLKLPFTKTMALPLYTAILIDTNSFRYPTVTARTHGLIAELLTTGINAHEAYNLIYGTKKLNQMHLLGHILKNTKINKRQNIAWIYIKKDELTEYGSHMEDTHAYINNLLSLDGIKIACMFRDSANHELRLSLRSHGDIDVGELASRLGGGGHSHSAATVMTIAGQDPEAVIAKTIQSLESFI
jgi:phosphoesterase RecJ-like protein